MEKSDFITIQNKIREFAKARDWDQFHSPKNLIMALTGEVGELAEIFQWLSSEEAQTIGNGHKKTDDVKDEIADVLIYTLRLADVLGLNSEELIHRKMAKNAQKYPVHLAKGNAQKYTELNISE